MTNALDNGIPVLTEVLQPPTALPLPAELSTPPTATLSAIASAPSTKLDFDIAPRFSATVAAAAQSLATLPTIGSDAWQQLEIDVTERISRQVLQRIDFVLEQRVRDSLADVLQAAVEGLATEIRAGLRLTLEEVIARAVAQELSRLQNQKL